jgi:hypothetical protein
MSIIFQINEKGDINLDKTNRTFCNIIDGDSHETMFLTARTIIITYFKYKEILKNSFKNMRNIFSDEEIKKILDNHLDIAFENYSDLRQYIKYEFINNGKKLDILFYYLDDVDSRHLIFHNITI